MDLTPLQQALALTLSGLFLPVPTALLLPPHSDVTLATSSPAPNPLPVALCPQMRGWWRWLSLFRL